MSASPTGRDPQPTAPPIAVAELSERCMGMASVAALVLNKFEQQLRGDIVAMEQRLAASDGAQLGRIAHALKGAAGATAANAVRDMASRIETQAKQGELDAIGESLRALKTEVDRCLAFMPAALRAFEGTAGADGRGSAG